MRSRIPAATALAVTLAIATSAHAFEIKHAESGELVRWRRASVAWTVDPSMKDVPGGKAALKGALAAWTEQGGAPKLVVGKAAAEGLAPGLDGTNAIFYAKDGYEPAGSALAVTVLSFDDGTGEVLDADIILNGTYDLGPIDPAAVAPTSAGDPGAERYDVARVVAHEMGHALGLSDELARNDALMYPYVPRAQALAAAPGTDDVAGLRALYAATPGSVDATDPGRAGCSGAVVARSGPRSAPGGALCAGGLLVAALVLARRKGRVRTGAAGCTVLAAVVMVLPPATSRATPETTDDTALVTAVRTTSIHGIFRSEIDLADCGAAQCPSGGRTVVWGGRLGGVTQVVGGHLVPTAGDRVVLARIAE